MLDYKNPSLAITVRVEDLLNRMTLPEKVAQLTSVWLTLDVNGGDFAPYQGQLSMSLVEMEPALAQGIGQISRPMSSRPVSARDGAAAINGFQKRMVEGTRLGVPALVHEECLTGFMTEGAVQFPSPLNYGATWNPALIEQVGYCIGQQMRSAGVHQGLGPVADVVRDARWGRVEECLGEDPLLVGSMVTAYIKGLQGSPAAPGVIGTLKHFCAYASSEGGRNMAPSHMGRRELREIHLTPFEMAVRLGPAQSVMNAYQDIDGVPCAASPWLLTHVLRGEWGFRGMVVADYWAVRMLQSLHGVAQDRAHASALALGSGLDVELPVPHCYWDGIPEALAQNLLQMDTVNEAVRRVLRQKIGLGLFEQPYVDLKLVSVSSAGAHQLSREVARQSITLLKNDGVLPLVSGQKAGLRVAVIGPNAHDPWAVFGNYTYHNHVASHFPDHPPPDLPPTLLDELRQRLGSNRVTYAQGCRIKAVDFAPMKMQMRALGLFADPPHNISHDASGIPHAVAVAEQADLVVLVLGDRSGHFRTGSVGEGTDADDLALAGVQAELASAILATGKPCVLVLVAGRPPVLGELADKAQAVLMAWLPGAHGNAAIADVLTGLCEPSGRLSVSLPSSTGAMPTSYNHKPLARGVPSQPAFDPAFAFGFGLSYTQFQWTDFELSQTQVPVDGRVQASITVRNVGSRPGVEVVQLYLRDTVACVTRPVLELKGFERLCLLPGQAARVCFDLATDAMAFVGTDSDSWIVEPGEMRLSVGASSADLRGSAAFTLTGKSRTIGLRQSFLAVASVQFLVG